MRTILFLLPLLTAEPKTEADEKAALATVEGQREILESLWDAPSERLTKLGSSLITRYRNRKADSSEMQYAYGVVLARHGLWDAAETNFKAVSQKRETSPAPWLGLAHVNARRQKFAEALEDARKAIELNADYPGAVESMATLATFLRTKPPAKLRGEKVKEAEQEVFPKLTPEQQGFYRAARDEVLVYIDELPALKQRLLEPIEELREKFVKLDEDRRKKETKLIAAQADYQEQTARLQRIYAVAQAQAARLDGMIQSALANGRPELAQAYQAQRVAALAAADASAVGIQATLNELDFKIRRLGEELAIATSKSRSLDAEIKGAEEAVAEQLAAPPPFWDAGSERKRVLAVGGMDPNAPAPPRKPRPPAKERSPEDRARSMLQIADSLRESGRPELARIYFERIVAEFGETDAAKDAQWELDQLPKEQDVADDAEEKPKRKRAKK